MTAVAMIEGEGDGKLHDGSTYLQKDNIRVRVDLARKTEYTFFPGQARLMQHKRSLAIGFDLTFSPVRFRRLLVLLDSTLTALELALIQYISTQSCLVRRGIRTS